MKYEFVSLSNPILLPEGIRRCPEGFDWAWADNLHWFAFVCEAEDEKKAEDVVESCGIFLGWYDKRFADDWGNSIDREWEEQQQNSDPLPPIKGGDLPLEDYVWLKVGESLLGEELIK